MDSDGWAESAIGDTIELGPGTDWAIDDTIEAPYSVVAHDPVAFSEPVHWANAEGM